MRDDESVILQEKQGDVLILTLNRPDRHNAMNALLSHRLGEVVSKSPQEGVKVIVITGAGEKSFCACGDMLEMSGKEAISSLLPSKSIAIIVEKKPVFFTRLCNILVSMTAALDSIFLPYFQWRAFSLLVF